MKGKIVIEISASSDSFGAASSSIPGIYGAGDSVSEVKRNALEAIRLYKECNPIDEWPIPLKEEWPVEWKYDVQSLLKYYEGIITNAALERLTGINRKQLWNYANGISKPRQAAKDKIENALHSLGNELLQLHL